MKLVTTWLTTTRTAKWMYSKWNIAFSFEDYDCHIHLMRLQKGDFRSKPILSILSKFFLSEKVHEVHDSMLIHSTLEIFFPYRVNHFLRCILNFKATCVKDIFASKKEAKNLGTIDFNFSIISTFIVWKVLLCSVLVYIF